MATAMNKVNAQMLTKLPVRELQLVSSMGVDLIITTPHKGEVVLKTTEQLSGFLKPITEFNVDQKGLLNQIKNLEDESIDFLFRQWLITQNGI